MRGLKFLRTAFSAISRELFSRSTPIIKKKIVIEIQTQNLFNVLIRQNQHLKNIEDNFITKRIFKN